MEPARRLLSNKLAIEVTDNTIKLVRTKGEYRRTVYIPKLVIEISLMYESCMKRMSKEKPDELVLTTLDEWVISITSFRGKRYMCYTKMDRNGDRIG